jgi:hypothetical protein
LQAIAALWSKKIAKYGGKWDFLGQTAILLTSYEKIAMIKKVKNWQDLSLSPALFWDTDATKIRLDTHAKTIVERVIMHGTWPEFKSILDYYGKDRIREIIIRLRYLDNRTLSFCSAYFLVPKSDFRCYTLRQLNPTRWNY